MTDLIFETVHGSHLYGLEHEGSDMDLYKVYENDGTTDLKQSIHAGVDTVRGSLDAFLKRATSGSHQSVEALFSPVKQWHPGMEEKYGPFIEGFRVSGGEAFAKYERTIHKFCYGNYKKRRHAVRLWLNLRDLRTYGRFNPRLDLDQQFIVDVGARLEGDELWNILR